MAEAKDPKSAKRIAKQVGEQMRRWRLNAGMTMEQVADKMEVSKGHISRAENAKGNLSLPMFLLYCEAIQTPVSRVLESKFLKRDRDFVSPSRYGRPSA